MPAESTFALEIRSPSLPRAVRAMDCSVTVLDLELHVLGIDFPLAGRANDDPTGCRLGVYRVDDLVRLPGSEALFPSGRTFVVNLSKGGLHGHRHVGGTKFARIVVIVLVKLDHAFEFLLRSRFSLT